MNRATQARAAMLLRIAEVDAQLQIARTHLKELRHNDPATGEVVLRGARLASERSRLEMRLGQMHQDCQNLQG